MSKVKKMYGVVGTSLFSKGGSLNDGNTWVEVSEQRPTANHELQADLTWKLNEVKKWEKEMEELDKATGIPRWFEDHIMDDHGGVSNNTYVQEKIDAKQGKRSKKPNK